MADAWIIDAVRTPRGKGKKDTGALSHTHPQELLAQTLQALSARNDVDGRDVEDLVARSASLEERIRARVDAALRARGLADDES